MHKLFKKELTVVSCNLMTLDLRKPNKFKILGLRSIIYVAMATIGILRNILQILYMFLPNLSFIPATSLK